MPQLNGGQALIHTLQQEGISLVFGVPGQGQYEAVDALYDTPGIRYISVRHEQAATYMADAYHRVSGNIAAALVVGGPGYYNAMAGMATALAVSSPILVITGTRHLRGRSFPTLPGQEAVTRWAGRANSPADIPGSVHQAMGQMRAGRPGPVALEISGEVFAATADVAWVQPSSYIQPLPPPESIRKAAHALLAARRPLIWAGGGVIRARAREPLQRLVDHLHIPVVTTRQGKGALSDRHPLCLGLAELRYPPMRQWVDASDLILAVGVGSNFAGYPQQIIEINVDPEGFAGGSSALSLLGDARLTLNALDEAVRQAASPIQSERVRDVAAFRAARFDPDRQLQPQWDFIHAVRRAMPDDGILVQGMTQMGYYSRNYFPVYETGLFLTASSLGTLGSAFPLALGAKVAQPERVVVALCGDGGFLYNSQELATAVQYEIDVVVIVFNDNAYGNVLRAQQEQFDGRIVGTKLHNPDFVQLAQSYGARGVRAGDAAQLEAAVREACTVKAPTIIEVPVGMMAREY